MCATNYQLLRGFLLEPPDPVVIAANGCIVSRDNVMRLVPDQHHAYPITSGIITQHTTETGTYHALLCWVVCDPGANHMHCVLPPRPGHHSAEAHLVVFVHAFWYVLVCVRADPFASHGVMHIHAGVLG